MNKNKFLCLLCIFVNLCLSAQTTGNKAFQLNVNNGDAYLNCGDISQLNNISQYTIEMWVNVTLSNLPDRFIMFKKEQTDRPPISPLTGSRAMAFFRLQWCLCCFCFACVSFPGGIGNSFLVTFRV